MILASLFLALAAPAAEAPPGPPAQVTLIWAGRDRKSTRLNSSHD